MYSVFSNLINLNGSGGKKDAFPLTEQGQQFVEVSDVPNTSRRNNFIDSDVICFGFDYRKNAFFLALDQKFFVVFGTYQFLVADSLLDNSGKIKKQGRIHGYQSCVRVGRGNISGHQTIWAGAVTSKK